VVPVVLGSLLYWPLRAFVRGAYFALPAYSEAPVDVVPIDYVADAVFALSQAREADGATFHLTAGAHVSSVGEVIDHPVQAPRAAPDRARGVPARAPAAGAQRD
jgi:hypothetical protein